MSALWNIAWDVVQRPFRRGRGATVGTLCHPADKAAQSRPIITTRPFIGTLVVLLASTISTLDGRITTFGLADVRGAVHAGFDEGAWITTAFTAGQMLIGPVSVWLGMVFGPRRLLMISSAVFGLSNLLLPFSPNLSLVLAFRMISGLSSGMFTPLAIGFVAQSLPRRFMVYGVAAYAMSIELSLNIAASIEGWFTDNWSWEWIFWGTALVTPFLLICIYFSMPRQPVKPSTARTNTARLSSSKPNCQFRAAGQGRHSVA